MLNPVSGTNSFGQMDWEVNTMNDNDTVDQQRSQIEHSVWDPTYMQRIW